MRCPECNHKMQQLKKYAVCDYCGFTIELESASKYIKHAPLERVNISPKIEKHASYEHVNYSPKTYVDQRKGRLFRKPTKFEFIIALIWILLMPIMLIIILYGRRIFR